MKQYTENKLGNTAVEYGVIVWKKKHTDFVSPYAFTKCFQTLTSYTFWAVSINGNRAVLVNCPSCMNCDVRTKIKIA